MVSTGGAADLGSRSGRWVCTGSITSTAWQASSLPISGSRLPARIPFPPHLPGIDDYSSRLRVSPENGLSWHGRDARAQPWEVGVKDPSGNKVYILLLAPRPAGKARATSIPAAVCKERATQPGGLRAAARRGAAEKGAYRRRCRSSTMSLHRLRRGALHLPARRSRQNAHLIS